MNGEPILATISAASEAISSVFSTLDKISEAQLRQKAYDELLRIGQALNDVFSTDPEKVKAAQRTIEASLAEGAAATGRVFSSSQTYVRVPAGVLKTLIEAFLKEKWETLGVKFS
ncbi:hypothetical protein [Candidatus Methylacidithermus pantelleriae]|uniref:Uncharacterized protein n=1 Tax=Candidatus Methylacidithermus pantelleriae TaxID=2744239 RepID=A0A8J2FSS2_9BACT|nr:hypothetical protein [Candidatus Methylacidithermus pantelleriae]CAF0700532.1 hypothetical protein MPNT_380003 [Candidatus Methylacidithermus pantelleriae]